MAIPVSVPVNSPSDQNKPTFQFNNDQIQSLKDVGFTDAEIEALQNASYGSKITANFDTLNKKALNALYYTGGLNESTKKLVYLQLPMAMLQAVSNPANWVNDKYVGPASNEINRYIIGKEVDLAKPSLDSLVMAVLTARADILQVQLEDQIESINKKNTTLDKANAMLARAKDLKEDAGSSSATTMPQDMIDFWQSLGAKRAEGDSSYTSGEWDVNIESLKGKIEALTSQSQLETTKLQQTINKYNQTFEMLSNFINKYFQSISTIIQNLR